ncbi:Serine/threonine-protein kinase ATR [Carpediemonas membranifera]|uniref:Serine/threonine-protein kinase ATR n=1 Tax=Carpediemonas membranifera TaxID=201153 RepID=A0A8J6AZ43_9EUKA|nr:Serine/threonine-protein kinase ATR [Carpediemonas membranifera]|eukprot:KAG9389489.1 Serine/threonine-protein kinase ATR [Carpediemonas membranifera]
MSFGQFGSGSSFSFGANTAKPQGAATPTFGAPAGGLGSTPAPGNTGFGAQPSSGATTTGFGAPASNTPTNTGFGQSTGFGAQSTGFGASAGTAGTSTGFGGFGASAQKPAGTAGFGAPAAGASTTTGFGAQGSGSTGFGAKPTGTSGFGSTATTRSTTAGFGSTTGFGSTATQPGATGLGAAPAKTGFGLSSSTTGFGASSAGFGASSANTAAPAAGSTGFANAQVVQKEMQQPAAPPIIAFNELPAQAPITTTVKPAIPEAKVTPSGTPKDTLVSLTARLVSSSPKPPEKKSGLGRGRSTFLPRKSVRTALPEDRLDIRSPLVVGTPKPPIAQHPLEPDSPLGTLPMEDYALTPSFLDSVQSPQATISTKDSRGSDFELAGRSSSIKASPRDSPTVEFGFTTVRKAGWIDPAIYQRGEGLTRILHNRRRPSFAGDHLAIPFVSREKVGSVITVCPIDMRSSKLTDEDTDTILHQIANHAGQAQALTHRSAEVILQESEHAVSDDSSSSGVPLPALLSLLSRLFGHGPRAESVRLERDATKAAESFEKSLKPAERRARKRALQAWFKMVRPDVPMLMPCAAGAALNGVDGLRELIGKHVSQHEFSAAMRLAAHSADATTARDLVVAQEGAKPDDPDAAYLATHLPPLLEGETDILQNLGAYIAASGLESVGSALALYDRAVDETAGLPEAVASPVVPYGPAVSAVYALLAAYAGKTDGAEVSALSFADSPLDARMPFIADTLLRTLGVYRDEPASQRAYALFAACETPHDWVWATMATALTCKDAGAKWGVILETVTRELGKLSPAEGSEAVARLAALGVPRELVVQAVQTEVDSATALLERPLVV